MRQNGEQKQIRKQAFCRFFYAPWPFRTLAVTTFLSFVALGKLRLFALTPNPLFAIYLHVLIRQGLRSAFLCSSWTLCTFFVEPHLSSPSAFILNLGRILYSVAYIVIVTASFSSCRECSSVIHFFFLRPLFFRMIAITDDTKATFNVPRFKFPFHFAHCIGL